MDHCQRDKPSHVRRVSFSQDELIPTIDLVKNESINSDECKVRWYQVRFFLYRFYFATVELLNLTFSLFLILGK
jgi:hypothetical protein